MTTGLLKVGTADGQSVVTLNWVTFQWLHKRLHTLIIEEQHRHITLDFSDVERAFPNGMVPLVVLLHQYQTHHAVRFEWCGPESDPLLLQQWAAHLPNYHDLTATSPTPTPVSRPNGLHRFEDDTSLYACINTHIRQLLERTTFAQGVLQSFEWALNEIAGNILIHAEVTQGWIQVVLHPSTQHLAIVVADGGIGIPDTIRHAFPELRNASDEDAIAHALKEGITSKPDYGQGKGLTGTLEIVKANAKGRLSVHSRSGLVEWREGRLNIKGNFPPFPGTLIDIQLDTSQPIDIERALWGSAPGYPFNESMYGKETPVGVMRLELVKEAQGFGNRVTGEKIRFKIENLLVAAPTDVIEIDFTGVDLIASSFADEVFGKLAVSLGFIGFASRIKLIGLNRFCHSLIDDVVQHRIVQSRSEPHK